MFDFPDSAGLQRITRGIFERGGIVSSVCHGYCGLLNTRLAGGSLLERAKPVGQRVTEDLKAQCTACGQRYDCEEYTTSIGSTTAKVKREVDPTRVDRS